MRVYDVTVEYQKEPIGIDVCPRFSWKLESEEENTYQKAYEIKVTKAEEEVWSSGRVENGQSLFVTYEGSALEAFSHYDVNICVWDNHENVAETTTFFETGLMSEDNWEGVWITTKEELPAVKTFSKEVCLQKGKKLRQARIYASALGVYDLEIDGKKMGDAYLAPGWTSYGNRVQYQTYDVTDFLQEKTRVSLVVGNGWYAGYLNGEGEHHLYGKKTACIAMIRITYEDGSVDVMGTDASWLVSENAIRSSEIYMGETRDLTLSLSENYAGDSQAVLLEKDAIPKRLLSQEAEPIRITKRFPVVQKILTPKGELVFDFGQNMAGLVEVELPPLSLLTGEKKEIRITHGEALDKDGNFYNENYRTARSEDLYRYGEGDVGKKVMPHFTYHGFRYICVEGVDSSVDPKYFTACAMHSDMHKAGTMTTSNRLVNRLIQNIEWGQRSNFFDIPTDCPQRDERLGWTGDAMIFSKTAMQNFNAGLFFKKWLRDVAVESDAKTGIPQIVPNVVKGSMGTSIWSDCATVIPWNLYMTYGDTGVLTDQYENMRLWVDWIFGQCRGEVLWMHGFQRGDWLALDSDESLHLMSGGTDKNLVANVFYAYSTKIVCDTAHILGKEEDAKIYDGRYQAIADAILREYVTASGRLVSETQTACALLLYFDLVAGAKKERIVQTLEKNLKQHKNKLTTGFVGTAYLCHALSENGLHDLAAELLLNEDYPGWLYAVKMGATTIWERWNSVLPDGTFDTSGMNSLNHYTYGSIGDWLYRKVAGIEPTAAGYATFAIRPYLTKGLEEVEASLETMYGSICVHTICKDGQIQVDVKVPVNTTATLYLPEKEGALVLGSGQYHYVYETNTVLIAGRYNMNTKFRDMVEDPAAKAILDAALPGMLDGPMASFILNQSPNEMLAYDAGKKEMFEQIIGQLNQSV